MEWGDLIDKGLEAYKIREQSKIDSRLARNAEQSQAYDEAMRMSGVNQVSTAVSSNKWLVFGGLAIAGLLVYVVVK